MATALHTALPAPHVAKLRALGYHSFEQLLGAAEVAGPELSSYLGEPVDALIQAAGVAPMAIPAAALQDILSSHFALGVSLEDIPQPTRAPAISPGVAAAAANVNLITPAVPIRDQRVRGTCVAHAALSAYEIYLHSIGAYQDMSEQFLYWNCKQHDGIPNTDGTWLGVAFPLLQRDGCCLEVTWRYVPNPISGNVSQGPPAAGSQLEALRYRLAGQLQLSPTSVVDMKAELARGRCVPFSIPVFNSWYRNTYVAYTGDLVMPLPNEVVVGGHAMCLVGSVDLPAEPEIGGGRFILRNSWGTAWGSASPFGAGYGTIPYNYIAHHGKEAYSIA